MTDSTSESPESSGGSIADVLQKIDELEKRLSAQVAEVKAEVAEVKAEVAEVKAEVAEVKAELDEFKGNVESQMTTISRKLTRLDRRLDHVERRSDETSVDAAIARRMATGAFEPAPNRQPVRPQTVPASQGHVFDPSIRKPAPFRWG